MGVDNRNNIADPRDPDNLKRRVFVYDVDPFTTAFDFSNLPYIILKLPTVEYDKKVVSNEKKWVSWSHEIIIRSARCGASNFSSQMGKQDVLNIGDDLNQTFNGQQNVNDLREANMHFVKLTKNDADSAVVDGKDVHEASYTLEYKSFLNTAR